MAIFFKKQSIARPKWRLGAGWLALVVGAALCFGGAAPLEAHGLGWSEITAPAPVALSFAYADGSPLAYGEIKIYSPENDEISFQRARTDKNGRMAFVPDRPGLWQIIASDGQGHRTEAKVEVGLQPKSDQGPDSASAAPESQGSGIKWGNTQKIIFGLSLILNLALLIRWRLVRRSR